MDQLVDMRYAGIDVALAVYWGQDLYSSTAWSTGGLEVLRAALDELDAEEVPHPSIGLFFDTYVLAGAHLTEPERIEWFRAQIMGFFERIPQRHRATYLGRPIIWLYYSDFANSFDPEWLEGLNDLLEEDLGVRPYWVAERSWTYTTWTDGRGQRHFDPRRPMPFDAFYRWGGAFSGAMLVEEPLRLVSLGPGYDDRKVVGREEKFARSREDGCYYARNWRDAQNVEARWVVIETWNELYEGSAIAETVEYARDYIQATANYATAFKRGRPILIPEGCPDLPPDEDVLYERPHNLGASHDSPQPESSLEVTGSASTEPSDEALVDPCQPIRHARPEPRRPQPCR